MVFAFSLASSPRVENSLFSLADPNDELLPGSSTSDRRSPLRGTSRSRRRHPRPPSHTPRRPCPSSRLRPQTADTQTAQTSPHSSPEPSRPRRMQQYPPHPPRLLRHGRRRLPSHRSPPTRPPIRHLTHQRRGPRPRANDGLGHLGRTVGRDRPRRRAGHGHPWVVDAVPLDSMGIAGVEAAPVARPRRGERTRRCAPAAAVHPREGLHAGVRRDDAVRPRLRHVSRGGERGAHLAPVELDLRLFGRG